MPEAKPPINPIIVLGVFVGGLLGLALWFVQGNLLWIVAGLALGLLSALFGGRTNNNDPPASS